MYYDVSKLERDTPMSMALNVNGNEEEEVEK